MHTKESLIDDLAASGIPRDATVLLHSSMKAIGEVEGRADTVLDALAEYFEPGLLVLPTHTWETVNKDGDVFDPESSLSCVGVLTNLFWKRPETVRSLHPTHSVAALGEDAQKFTAGEELTRTPCSQGGVYGRLLDRGAYILFLGVPMTRNTFVHGVEEWNTIPNRLAEKPTELAVRSGGSLIQTPQNVHSAPIPDISENYGKLRPVLQENGDLQVAKFGDAELLITTAPAVNRVATALLERDPDIFLDDRPVPKEWELP